jgi:REP element-mobilizing transposase RayT
VPHNDKLFINNTVILVTTRIQQGLPLVPSDFMNDIIQGIIARANKLYPVPVCHALFMANHFHMLLKVNDPEDISSFVGYIKAETSHAINKLQGLTNRTIWEDGYDSPVILTPEDVIKRIVYIYTNPQKANLVDRIEEYPGVSTWQMFLNKSKSIPTKWIRRSMIPKLKANRLSIPEQTDIAYELQKKSTVTHQFELSPDAWLQCFPEYDLIPEKIHSEILQRVREEEENIRKLRRRPVMGARQLKRQAMDKTYTPKKRGRRSICICYNKEYRWRFVRFFHALKRRAETVFRSWKAGNLSIPYPPGLFAPRIPRVANLLLTI